MLAVAGTIFLLSPIASISPPPPLAASPSAIRTPVESRFLGHANSNERIEVAVRPDGTPVRIVVTQRLDLTAKGDYYFVIPAPATRVLPGPGSESQPGLRDLGIVWQGFANKHRVLSATATMKVSEAATALPLRISVERGNGVWTVRLANATGRRLRPLPAGRPAPRCSACWRSCGRSTTALRWSRGSGRSPAGLRRRWDMSGPRRPCECAGRCRRRGRWRCPWTRSLAGGSHGPASSPFRARSGRRCGCGSSSSRRSRSSRRRPSSSGHATRCVPFRPESDRSPRPGGTRTTSPRPKSSARARRSTPTARCGSRRRRWRLVAGRGRHARDRARDRAGRRRAGRARGALGTLVGRCNRQSIFASVEGCALRSGSSSLP